MSSTHSFKPTAGENPTHQSIYAMVDGEKMCVCVRCMKDFPRLSGHFCSAPLYLYLCI